MPFDFIWFGRTESRITIGTNGVITFGTAQLHNGASEPVPCQWTTGNSGCEGVDYGSTASDPGSAAPDGVIAVFWAVRAPPLNSVSAPKDPGLLTTRTWTRRRESLSKRKVFTTL